MMKSIAFEGYDTKNMNTGRLSYYKKVVLFKIFWIFMIGSVAGFFIETMWCLIKNGSIECRSSVIIGPFTTVYGLGALVLYIGKRLAGKNILHIFTFGAVVGTVVEYICSFFQESLVGSVSWDYSRQPLNINGRVCLIYSVFWGGMAILWYVVIQSMVDKLISKIPPRIYKPLTWSFAVFLVLDIVVSITAVTRWSMRLDGVPSNNIISAMLDRLFPNEFMSGIYPNMRW